MSYGLELKKATQHTRTECNVVRRQFWTKRKQYMSRLRLMIVMPTDMSGY